METRRGEGRFGAALEFKEYLTALRPKIRREGVHLLVLGPSRSPLADLIKTPEEIAVEEVKAIINPRLLIILSGLPIYQERIEAWVLTIDKDVTSTIDLIYQVYGRILHMSSLQ